LRALKKWMLILGLGGACAVIASDAVDLVNNHRVFSAAIPAQGLPCEPQRERAFLALIDTSVRAAKVTRWTAQAGRGALVLACVLGIALARASMKRRLPN